MQYFFFFLTSVHLALNHFPFKCVLNEFNLLTILTGFSFYFLCALILFGELVKVTFLVVYFLYGHLSYGTGIHRREIELCGHPYYIYLFNYMLRQLVQICFIKYRGDESYCK